MTERHHPYVAAIEDTVALLAEQTARLKAKLETGARIDTAPLMDEVRGSLLKVTRELQDIHAAHAYYAERDPGDRPPGVGGS